jgi:cysteinyl-tRNA synthetase
MPLEIYNSLTRKKEVFKPVSPGKINMYVCGMTVYSDTHIGHARTYLAFDIIRRYLEYKEYHVTYVQNITDVDDKIIAAANKEGVDPLEYSKKFTDICLHDLDALGIRKADMYPKASETIPDMIKMIKALINKDYAYVADGDVYFSVDKFTDYGKLSGQNPEEMKSGARIKPGEKKQNPLDFALWKKAKMGEPSWPSPWGDGRPGWHIECSTMSSKYLGLPFDIHGGGMDLRFPHHENEIAQAEAATGKEFAKIWMHIGLLTIDGEKMSKSIGNILNVKEVLQKWDAEIIRMFFAQTHYRSPPDFSENSLQEIQQSLTRIHRVKENLEECKKNGEKQSTNKIDSDQDYLKEINEFIHGFESAMDDDFNTPKAFAEIFSFVTKTNRYLKTNSNPKICSKGLDALVKIGNILTLFQTKSTVEEPNVEKLQSLAKKFNIASEKIKIDEILEELLSIRENARKQKDWTTADTIRNTLTKIGYEIQDTSDGPKWRKT